MRKRKGLRAQMRDYNAVTREIKRAADKERETSRVNALTVALELCVKEIWQFHKLAYPDCQGRCPAHAAMDAALVALGYTADQFAERWVSVGGANACSDGRRAV